MILAITNQQAFGKRLFSWRRNLPVIGAARGKHRSSRRPPRVRVQTGSGSVSIICHCESDCPLCRTIICQSSRSTSTSLPPVGQNWCGQSKPEKSVDNADESSRTNQGFILCLILSSYLSTRCTQIKSVCISWTIFFNLFQLSANFVCADCLLR